MIDYKKMTETEKELFDLFIAERMKREKDGCLTKKKWKKKYKAKCRELLETKIYDTEQRKQIKLIVRQKEYDYQVLSDKFELLNDYYEDLRIKYDELKQKYDQLKQKGDKK